MSRIEHHLYCLCINALLAIALIILEKYLGLYYCVNSVRIRSYSGPHFQAFGLNTERFSVSPRIQSKWTKMLTRTNNPEYGHFLRSVSNIYNGAFYENIYRFFLPIINISNVPSNMLAWVVIPLWIFLQF